MTTMTKIRREMSHRARSGRTWILAAALGLMAAAGGTAFGLSAIADSGQTVAAQQTRSLRADFTARLVAMGKTDLAPARTSPFNTLRASVDGRDWSFSTYRNAAGDQCMVEVVPGEGRGFGCRSAATLFANGPVYASWGSRQRSNSGDRGHWETAWVEGLAAPEVATVELVLTNCATLDLPLGPDRAFFGVVGSEALKGHAMPYAIRARDALGRTLTQIAIELGPVSAKRGTVKAPASPAVSCG